MTNQETVYPFEDFLDDFISHGASLGDVSVISIHNLTVPPTWHIDKRNQDHFFCTIIVGGIGTLTACGKKYRLRAGSFYCIGPDVVHSISTDRNNPLQIRTTHFSLGDRETRPVFLYQEIGMLLLQRMENLMNTGAVSWLKPENTYKSHMLRNILVQCLMMIGDFITGGSVKNNNFADTVDSLDPENDYSIRELAGIFGYSEKSFIRKFRQVLGITPHRYLINRKISRAKYFLANSELSVKEISVFLKYKDPYLFSRQFKHETGMSPTGFRQDPKQTDQE